MRTVRPNRWLSGLLVVGTGTLAQVQPGGCRDYLGATAVTALDMCAIVNCDGGTFFNFCQPVAIFVDCPGLADAQQP